VRRTADDRLVAALPGPPHVPRSRPVDADRLRRRLEDLLPGATGTRTSHAWRAPVALTRDGTPRVGLDRETGLGWAVGFGRDGLGASNVAGRTVADLVTGGVTPLTRLPWVGHLGPAWPPAPLARVAASMALRGVRLADAVESRSGREVGRRARTRG
jgi:glycine/D-amino acid oxidase-like deaminating enzyme